MALELKENTLLGKVLAENGRTVILPRHQAIPLADRYQGTLVPSASGRYMIRLPEWANNLKECDCGSTPVATMGQPRPETYNQYPDHEVQMARQELYRTAKLALMTHDLLSRVGERQGLEGWVQSKLTRAADYMETVFAYLDYEMRYPSGMMEDNTVVAPSQQQMPSVTGNQQQPVPGQSNTMGSDGKTRTPGMVKMAKIDTNGKIQGQPIMVSQAAIKSKQQAGFHVIGEDASGGSSSAGGMASGMGGGNGFLNGGPGAITRAPKKKRTTESKVEVNFTADDIKRMEGMRDILKMKQYAKQLIATPSEKPIKPQKIAWFNHVIDGKKDSMQLIKFMYDMLLGGEGKAVLGTRYSMEPNNYRKVFNDITTEAFDTLDPTKPYGLANPRILQVGDDPQGINDFKVTGNNVLSIYPFDAKNWNNEQMHARSKGYMLKYVGKDPRKAQMANAGTAPQMGSNMRGEKLK
jgi:hypothetical protein